MGSRSLLRPGWRPSPRASGRSGADRAAQHNRAGTEGGVTPRAWLLGGALVALGVGVIALRALVARAPAPTLPAVAPLPLAAGSPYNGQTWAW